MKKVEFKFDSKVFGIKPNKQVVFDSIVSQQASLRQGTSAVKNRSAVSGGGKKPWKQKGTGRARQGTIRAPQWRGGGVVFGPSTNSNYTKQVNKKVRKLALKSILSIKAKAKEIMIIDNIEFKKPSTKDMLAFLKGLGIENQKVLMVSQNFEANTFRSLSNLRYADHCGASGINVLDLAHYTYLVASKEAIETITKGLK